MPARPSRTAGAGTFWSIDRERPLRAARQGDHQLRASLPLPQSDLARELLKDPYDFEFLATAREAQEREIERGLVAHVREFLLELGAGFAFSAASTVWR